MTDLSDKEEDFTTNTVAVPEVDTHTAPPPINQRIVWACSVVGGFFIFYSAYQLVSFGNLISSGDLSHILGINVMTDSNAIAARVGGSIMINPAGMVCGALTSGFTSNRFGRLRAAQLSVFFTLVGLALEISAKNLPWLLICRFLSGYGVGMSDAIMPVWITEMAPAASRGSHVATELWWGAGGGTLSAYWVAYACTQSSNQSLQWRLCLACPALVLIVNVFIFSWLPETPRWLISKGRMEEAKVNYGRLYGSSSAADQGFASLVNDMKSSQLDSDNVNYFTLLSGKQGKNTARRFWLTVFVQMLATFGMGFGILLSFSGQVFALAGLSAHTTAIVAGMNLLLFWLAITVCVLGVDRIGRRNLMMFGALLSGIMLVLIGIQSHFLVTSTDPAYQRRLGAGIIFSIFAYTLFFGGSLAALSWIYPAEIFQQEYRALGGGISIAAFSTGNGLTSMVASYLLARIGSNTFFLFGGLALSGSLVTYCIVPDTTGMSLEDIHVLFDGDLLQPAWMKKAFA